MVGACPEGNEVMEAPGEIVAAVGVNRLEESADYPEVHGQDVQIACDCAPEYWSADRAEA